MAENTKIEWADHTFNPWTGCTKVSAACDHCYAEGWAKRSGLVEWGPHAPRRRTSQANWRKPLKWDREASAAGRRAKVFCASLADVFDNHGSIEPKWRADLWELIASTPNLDWLLLTKRPQNIVKFAPERWFTDGIPRNVWLGTTVENQEEADRRIPHLIQCPARVRFLSCEPLLGAVSVRRYISKLEWIIAGGESGPGARPSHPDWFRSLRDQCHAVGMPFFFKQWGEWGPDDFSDTASKCLWLSPDGSTVDGGAYEVSRADCIKPMSLTVRHGKKRAGRMLDGHEWNWVPSLKT